jgi:hypothetical protein
VSRGYARLYIPVHVAMAAGHSDPAFTLRTYAHSATDASTRIRAAQSHVDVGLIRANSRLFLQRSFLGTLRRSEKNVLLVG